MRLKILGVEAQLPTTEETSTTLGGAKEIRLVHDMGGNTSHLVTINDGAATPTTVASFNIVPGEALIIRKEPTQKIWSASSDVRAVAVSYIS